MYSVNTLMFFGILLFLTNRERLKVASTSRENRFDSSPFITVPYLGLATRKCWDREWKYISSLSVFKADVSVIFPPNLKTLNIYSDMLFKYPLNNIETISLNKKVSGFIDFSKYKTLKRVFIDSPIKEIIISDGVEVNNMTSCEVKVLN